MGNGKIHRLPFEIAASIVVRLNDDNENSRLFQKFGERKGRIVDVGTTLTNILN